VATVHSNKLELWDFLERNNIQSAIKPDKKSKTDTQSDLRNKTVKERNKIGYKKWTRKHDYGRRWPASIFSAIKRIFGEQNHATSENGMLHEAACKIWAYQRLKTIRRGIDKTMPQNQELCNTAF
jgi:hypothetical protein